MSAGQWILVLVIAVALLLLLWWWLHRERPAVGRRSGKLQFAQATPAPQDDEKPPAASALPPVTPPEPDDLQRISGIGPRATAALAAAGLTTFAALAAQEPAALRAMLKEQGVRGGDPSAWPAQAALAAQGRWDELAAMQANLLKGRKR